MNGSLDGPSIFKKHRRPLDHLKNGMNYRPQILIVNSKKALKKVDEQFRKGTTSHMYIYIYTYINMYGN